MSRHQALFAHRTIDMVHTLPLIAVIDGDFAYLAKHIQPPAISAHMSATQEALQLSFMVEKSAETAQLQAISGKSNLTRADYLWEKDCFECFIRQADGTRYIEINANLLGEYNIYQFTAYRTPKVMPPVENTDYLLCSFVDHDDRHLYFGIEISSQSAANSLDVTKLCLNPAAILYPMIDGQAVPIYYAHRHASPPDFHDAAQWQRLNLSKVHDYPVGQR